MSKNLSAINKRKVRNGLSKLEQAGLTEARWLALLDADESALERVVSTWPMKRPAFAYGTRELFDLYSLNCHTNTPTPTPHTGEIVVYCGKWDIEKLDRVGVNVNSYNLRTTSGRSKASRHQMKPGFYRIILKVPGSENKTWLQQYKHKKYGLVRQQYPDWSLLSAPLGALALDVHFKMTGKTLLKRGEQVRTLHSCGDDERYSLAMKRNGEVCLKDDVEDDEAKKRVFVGICKRVT